MLSLHATTSLQMHFDMSLKVEIDCCKTNRLTLIAQVLNPSTIYDPIFYNQLMKVNIYGVIINK